MKNSKFITRAIIVTGFLAAVAVPAANAVSENTPNWGNSGKAETTTTTGSSSSSNGNGFGNGGTGYWGGCRGVHGGDNSGQGLGNGLGNGFNTGNGNGNAYGHDKPWKQCGPTPPPPPPGVEGSNYTLPQTR